MRPQALILAMTLALVWSAGRSVFGDELLVTVNGIDQLVPVQSFMPGSQDVGGLATITPDQRSVTLTGNAWKRLAIPYTVTANTMLEFDFSSTHLAEIHEVRLLDTDSYLTATINWIYYLGGTQYGAGTYTNLPNVQHFVINVGSKFQGAIANLILTHDNDANDPVANGTYANLQLYEYSAQSLTVNLNGTTTPVTVNSFMPGQQDVAGTAMVSGGNTVALAGNTWKCLPIDYTVTANTVLEFDFTSTHLAEIHELRLLNAADYNTATINYIFNLGGTQYGGGNYTTLGQSQHFRVQVGALFQGAISNIVLTHDNDANDPAANGNYANIQLYESAPNALNVNLNGITSLLTIQSFMPGSQDISGTATIVGGGTGVTLTGNSWKRVQVDYAITVDTVIEFDFSSTKIGEIHQIRLIDADDYFVSTLNWIYDLCGSQATTRYTAALGTTQHFSVPIGSLMAGKTVKHIVFTNDNDALVPDVNGTYSNFHIYQAPPPANKEQFRINGDRYEVRSFMPGVQDNNGLVSIGSGSKSMTLTGNSWKRVDLTYNATPQTYMILTYSSTKMGELQGVGFSETGDSRIGKWFMYAFMGSEQYHLDPLYIQPQYQVGNDGRRTYIINVGANYTGVFNHVVFINDQDAVVPVGQEPNGAFANVSIVEGYPN